jgi:hypothetical protein
MEPDEIKLLSNQDIPEAVRTRIAEQLFSSSDRAADRELEIKRLAAERTKFLWNTPVVAALAGLLTLSATFIFDRLTAKDETTHKITLEEITSKLENSEARLRQELEMTSSRTHARLEAEAKEREFQYEIVRSELTNPDKTNAERAAILLFLVRAGVLNSLNGEELRKMAEAQIERPDKSIIPRLTPSSTEDAATPPPFPELANVELALEVQQRLSELGYLDPPSEGTFNRVSTWALKSFLERNGVADDGHFGPSVAEALNTPSHPLPDLSESGTWIDKVVRYMAANDYWICRYPECKNIVYLEGADPDGTLNDNRPNWFNDTRLVFWLDNDGKLEWRAWEATTEPGVFWTDKPMNPKGVARIKFGQYAAWSVGIHLRGRAAAQEALVQVKPISVYRDLNKDYLRNNDFIDNGLFGINQHSGYDLPRDNIGSVGAGNLIGRTKEGHLEFMQLIKADPRYRAHNGYAFISTIVPADEVLN